MEGEDGGSRLFPNIFYISTLTTMPSGYGVFVEGHKASTFRTLLVLRLDRPGLVVELI